MDSQTMVERYGAKLEGWLYEDYDLILMNTLFQKVDPQFDKEAIIHWWMNVYKPNEESKLGENIFSSWSNASYSFKYATRGGYNPQTLQTVVKLGCIKKDPVEAQIEELRMWIPHIKPCKDENGLIVKYISIFEHTLSEFGSYSLSIVSDTEVTLNKMAWHMYSEVKKFSNLETAVDYVRKHHWYKKK